VPFFKTPDDVPSSPDLHAVLGLVGCDEVVVAPDVEEDIEVFKVVNASPSRRVLLHPWHLGRKPIALRVSRYQRLPDQEGVVVFAPTAEIVNVDLEALSSSALFLDVWQTLVSWADVAMGSKLLIRQEARRQIADSLPVAGKVVLEGQFDQSALALCEDEERGVRPIRAGLDEAAPLFAIATRGGIVEDGAFVKDLSGLTCVMPTCVFRAHTLV
jgi:hypothetical protein